MSKNTPHTISTKSNKKQNPTINTNKKKDNMIII